MIIPNSLTRNVRNAKISSQLINSTAKRRKQLEAGHGIASASNVVELNAKNMERATGSKETRDCEIGEKPIPKKRERTTIEAAVSISMDSAPMPLRECEAIKTGAVRYARSPAIDFSSIIAIKAGKSENCFVKNVTHCWDGLRRDRRSFLSFSSILTTINDRVDAFLKLTTKEKTDE